MFDKERPIRPEVLGPDGDPERNWAMACHLSAFAGYFIPFGNVLGPLVVWLFKGQHYALVDRCGREALNFQISMTLYILVASLLIVVVIGVPLLIGLAVFNLVMIIVATVKTRSGEDFRYPITIRFFR